MHPQRAAALPPTPHPRPLSPRILPPQMSWDDLSKNDMLWPSVREVNQYRRQVGASAQPGGARWRPGRQRGRDAGGGAGRLAAWRPAALPAGCSHQLLNLCWGTGQAPKKEDGGLAPGPILPATTQPPPTHVPLRSPPTAPQVYQMVRRHIETHPGFDSLPVTWVRRRSMRSAAQLTAQHGTAQHSTSTLRSTQRLHAPSLAPHPPMALPPPPRSPPPPGPSSCALSTSASTSRPPRC